MIDGLDFVSIIAQHTTCYTTSREYRNAVTVMPEREIDDLVFYTTGDLVQLHRLIDAELQSRAAEDSATDEGMPEPHEDYSGAFYQDDDARVWGVGK